MYCLRCSTQLRDGARYCQRCGASVSHGGSASAYTPAQPYGTVRYRRPAGASVAALICGIVSAVLVFCTGVLALPVGIVAIGLGTSAIRKVNAGTAGGKGLAVTGLVCGLFGAVLGVIQIVLLILVGTNFFPFGR